ncbi:MAG TPA: selenocysteine-specific translation elongation factor [Actinomycetota bacterium]|jgi:selenocysteine-specific elongation factor
MHVIGTAGHVDHGKSTLVERLTGIDPDRFAEEKRRGLTIDLGFAWLRLPSGLEIGLVDVPGHERFIKNMLAGAGSITVCLFVVAANEGWKPQSAEHLAILDVLGVSAGVVALTKADAVSEDDLELARMEVEERLQGSTLASAPVIACSAVTSKGIDELVAALDETVRATPPAPDHGRPRLWVDRVFTIAGAGTVVTGTLAGGSFSSGDAVEIVPERRHARIRSIQSHKKEIATVEPGNRVALNLAGLERQGAQRGDAVVSPGAWRASRVVDAYVRVVDEKLAGRAHELNERGAHLLYVGSAETPVRIRLYGGGPIEPGHDGFAQLHLRDALPMARGDRFVLRDAGRVLTFGGGTILDPLAPRARRDDLERVELLARLQDASASESLERLLETYGSLPVDDAELRAGTTGPVPGVQALGGLLVSARRLAELQKGLRDALGAHHRARPLERGPSREVARAATALESREFDALIGITPDVVEDGAIVRLEAHRVELAPQEQRARDELVGRIEASGFQPPFAKDLGGDPALVRALVDAGELVRIGDFYLTRRRADDAIARVRSAIEERGPLTVAEIRDLLGTSRKYAVPLCEWLDATSVTRRQGDVRALGPTETLG